MTSKWVIKVPGKLMIAGEYAILEPKQHAVVMAVDRYVAAEIKENRENVLSLPELGLVGIEWRNEGDTPVFNHPSARLKLVQQALKTMNQFFREQSIDIRSCHLTITSELADTNGRKYGLGSSAAITVAVIASLLSLHHVQLPSERIFKLAALSHLKAQGNGSGADIAAATFGGWIDYIAFPPNWVLDKWEKGIKICELIGVPWPNLAISHLKVPSDFELCVGWTTQTARTGPMVKKIQEFRLTHPDKYAYFLQESSSAVSRLVKGFETNNYELAMAGIYQNRIALQTLGEFTNISIETPKLQELCDTGEEFGEAKLSGAGGGDCGIAFIHHAYLRPKLYDAWVKGGIIPLPLHVSQNGLVATEFIHSI